MQKVCELITVCGWSIRRGSYADGQASPSPHEQNAICLNFQTTNAVLVTYSPIVSIRAHDDLPFFLRILAPSSILLTLSALEVHGVHTFLSLLGSLWLLNCGRYARSCLGKGGVEACWCDWRRRAIS